MTTNEYILLEQLKATTIALRVLTGTIEPQYMQTARAMTSDVIMHERYRDLTPAMRAAIADSGTAIIEAGRKTGGSDGQKQ